MERSVKNNPKKGSSLTSQLNIAGFFLYVIHFSGTNCVLKTQEVGEKFINSEFFKPDLFWFDQPFAIVQSKMYMMVKKPLIIVEMKIQYEAE